MSMKDVLISINSVHGIGEEQEDTLQFTTDGLYSFDGRVGRLSYMETDVTGLEGTRTSVSVSDGRMVVDRDGFITGSMEFTEGGHNIFQYNTPYGYANVDVDTKRIQSDLNYSGGSVEMDYVISVEHSGVTANRVRLSIRELDHSTLRM